jgi:hypothetical protein
MIEEKEIDKIDKIGQESAMPPVGELFQVPKLRFWGKKTWNFF